MWAVCYQYTPDSLSLYFLINRHQLINKTTGNAAAPANLNARVILIISSFFFAEKNNNDFIIIIKVYTQQQLLFTWLIPL